MYIYISTSKWRRCASQESQVGHNDIFEHAIHVTQVARQKMPPPSQSAHNKEALFLRVAMQGRLLATLGSQPTMGRCLW